MMRKQLHCVAAMTGHAAIWLVVIIGFGLSCSVRAAEGVVAHYSFEEGPGGVVKDWSGNGNDGKNLGAKYVNLGAGKGHALAFDTADATVNCGDDPSLDLTDKLTIAFWFNPQTVVRGGEAGLVGKDTGSYTLSYGRNRNCWFYINAGANGCRTTVEIGCWQHIAATFDGSDLKVYQDGRLRSFCKSKYPEANRAKEGLYLRKPVIWGGKVEPTFKCMMDDVRIYNRALSDDEILSRYREEAGAKGKDTTFFDRPRLAVHAYPALGDVVVTADFWPMRSLLKGARLEVTVFDADRRTVAKGSVPAVAETCRAEILFSVGDRRPGEYAIQAVFRDREGHEVGKKSVEKFAFPEKPWWLRPGVRILNNLVVEVLNVKVERVAGRREYTFPNPKDGWVFIASQARVEGPGKIIISVDAGSGEHAVIVHEKGDGHTLEAMRRLPAGEHKLVVRAEGKGRIESLVVRSIPELLYSRFKGNSHVREFGLYEEAFLTEHVLRNVNTLVFAGRGGIPTDFGKEWRRRGGKWLVRCGVPKGTAEKPLTVEDAQRYISETGAFVDPLADGAIADEFGFSQPYCAMYAEALMKLKRTPEFKSKCFCPYANHLYNGPEGVALIRAVAQTGGAIIWKNYLDTPATEAEARRFLKEELVEPARGYRHAWSESLEHAVVLFGNFSIPREFSQTSPLVNYKAFLDMEYNLVANDPAFWGTYGLGSYLSSYTDEETARWAMRLFRHYGIEGKRERATDDPYELPHLENGDFAEGLLGWTVRPAEQGSIRPDRKPGFGWLQGRYGWKDGHGRRSPEGETVLVTRRNAKRPNVFAQEIKDLDPGRLYSFRMYTSDFKDMARKEQHAVAVKLDNVTLIPENCFTHVFPSIPSHAYAPYGKENPAWMNYHWRVFRANGPTAKLTVSDWASNADPGGPAGQELMYNYVCVQPYYSE